MDFDIYFCDSALTQATWKARLTANGATIVYETANNGQPETGNVMRMMVTGGAQASVKSKKFYESPVDHFVIIAKG